MRCARAALCTCCTHLLEQPHDTLPQGALGAKQLGVAHDVQAEARAGEGVGNTTVHPEHTDGLGIVGAHERQQHDVALLARKLLDGRHEHLSRRAAAAAAARARVRALLVQLAPDEKLLAAVGRQDGKLRGRVALPQKVRREGPDEARLVRVGARLCLGLESLGLGGGAQGVQGVQGGGEGVCVGRG